MNEITVERFKKYYSGSVRSSQLAETRRDGDNAYFPCPLGCTDHYATRSLGWADGRTILSPLHCHHCHQSWIVIADGDPEDKNRPHGEEIIGIIADEERSYKTLLEKWCPLVPKRITAQEAFKWRTEKGVPEELLEDRCDDAHLYRQLIENHSALSASKASFKKEIF